MGAERTEYSGQLSAWLQKKKSGTSALRVREYNKRFFTLDFDTHTFFYAHAEGSKKVSAVTSFSDLLDVKMSEALADKGDNISECSKSSKLSMFRRPSFMGAGKDSEERTLTVLTRPARAMELLCSSQAEASTWFEALKTAIAMDKGLAPRDAVSAAPCDSSEGESGAAGYPKPVSAAPSAPPSGGYPTPAPVPVAAAALAAGGAADGAAWASAAQGATNAGEEQSDDAADAPPPPVRGTFLDLSIEEEAAEDLGPSALSGKHSDNPGDTTVVEEAGAVALQASDFGFAADEDSDSAASSASSPRGDAHAGTVGVAPVNGEAPSPAAAAAVKPGSATYGDRHEGLSMKERLANLEFSEDEDEDDDDPLGLKQK